MLLTVPHERDQRPHDQFRDDFTQAIHPHEHAADDERSRPRRAASALGQGHPERQSTAVPEKLGDSDLPTSL